MSEGGKTPTLTVCPLGWRVELGGHTPGGLVILLGPVSQGGHPPGFVFIVEISGVFRPVVLVVLTVFRHGSGATAARLYMG